MEVSAKVHNRKGLHEAIVTTNGVDQTIPISPRESGFGSSVNGGELLFLALATCYCNDVYREAEKIGMRVHDVQVEALGEFGGPGEPALNVRYHVRVAAEASDREIRALLIHTDSVAEIQNTLRSNVSTRLGHVETVSVE
jgi:organic hydroperoxide reductase OsmC/OhrA